MLPFTKEVYDSVFAQYSAAIWPLQIIGWLACVSMVACIAMGPGRTSDRLISSTLAILWLWIGAVYHLQHLASILWISDFLGLAFVLQGIMLLWTGAVRNQLVFRYLSNFAGIFGAVLLTVAVFAYPIIAWSDGRPLAGVQFSGTAPTPTTIFTCAILLLTAVRPPRHLLAVPLAWAIIAGAAAWELGITEEAIAMSVVVVAIAVISFKARQSQAPTSRPCAE